MILRGSTIKRLIFLVLLGVGFIHNLGANSLTATQVMKLVDQRYDGESFIRNSTMVLIDSRDRQRKRNIIGYSKDYGEDTKRLLIFDSPADIKGTAYLNYDWSNIEKDDDSWLYFPALQKTKRIASGDQSGAFLGSDFSYSDINGLEFAWYDFHFLSESEIINGVDCWQIEIVAKPQYQQQALDATGYTKELTWVRKDNLLQIKGKKWVKKGNRVKYFSASDIQKIDGVWVAMKVQMVSTKNNKKEHASVVQINHISFNKSLSDGLFNAANLSRGVK